MKIIVSRAYRTQKFIDLRSDGFGPYPEKTTNSKSHGTRTENKKINRRALPMCLFLRCCKGARGTGAVYKNKAFDVDHYQQLILKFIDL